MADPLRHLSLSPWLALPELRRGRQLGPADYKSVWCIGAYRLPNDWVKSSREDRRRTRVGPLVFVNPIALRRLLEPDGVSIVRLGERLVQMDLMIASHTSCLTWPAKIPGSGHESATPFYALRGEVGFVTGDDMPAGLRAVAAVVRVSLAGWYAMCEPIELRPDPGFKFAPYVGKRKAQATWPTTKAQSKRPSRAQAIPLAPPLDAVNQLSLW